jgi:hypothetical protein
MAVLQIRSGLDTLPNDVKDKIIAPKISGLTKPGVPNMSPERRYLLNARKSFHVRFECPIVKTAGISGTFMRGSSRTAPRKRYMGSRLRQFLECS